MGNHEAARSLGNLVRAKIAFRGGREIARGLFVASGAAVMLGIELLIGHLSTAAVVIGVLLIVAGIALFVRCSKKRTI